MAVMWPWLTKLLRKWEQAAAPRSMHVTQRAAWKGKFNPLLWETSLKGVRVKLVSFGDWHKREKAWVEWKRGHTNAHPHWILYKARHLNVIYFYNLKKSTTVFLQFLSFWGLFSILSCCCKYFHLPLPDWPKFCYISYYIAQFNDVNNRFIKLKQIDAWKFENKLFRNFFIRIELRILLCLFRLEFCRFKLNN